MFSKTSICILKITISRIPIDCIDSFIKQRTAFVYWTIIAIVRLFQQ